MDWASVLKVDKPKNVLERDELTSLGPTPKKFIGPLTQEQARPLPPMQKKPTKTIREKKDISDYAQLVDDILTKFAQGNGVLTTSISNLLKRSKNMYEDMKSMAPQYNLFSKQGAMNIDKILDVSDDRIAPLRKVLANNRYNDRLGIDVVKDIYDQIEGFETVRTDPQVLGSIFGKFTVKPEDVDKTLTIIQDYVIPMDYYVSSDRTQSISVPAKGLESIEKLKEEKESIKDRFSELPDTEKREAEIARQITRAEGKLRNLSRQRTRQDSYNTFLNQFSEAQRKGKKVSDLRERFNEKYNKRLTRVQNSLKRLKKSLEKVTNERTELTKKSKAMDKAYIAMRDAVRDSMTFLLDKLDDLEMANRKDEELAERLRSFSPYLEVFDLRHLQDDVEDILNNY